MSFGFTSLAHAFASIGHDIVTGAKKAESIVAKLGTDAQAAAPVIEAVTSTIDPQAVVIERAAFATLGTVLQEVDKLSGDALNQVGTHGLNIPLDQQTVADLKALATTMKAKLTALGINL